MIERVYVNHTKVFLVIITASLEYSVQLFCVSSWRNRILGVTSYNFYTVDFSKFRTFPKFNFLQHKSPHVVAEPVGIQFFSLAWYSCKADRTCHFFKDKVRTSLSSAQSQHQIKNRSTRNLVISSCFLVVHLLPRKN